MRQARLVDDLDGAAVIGEPDRAVRFAVDVHAAAQFARACPLSSLMAGIRGRRLS
jgi:hypothetical protein